MFVFKGRGGKKKRRYLYDYVLQFYKIYFPFQRKQGFMQGNAHIIYMTLDYPLPDKNVDSTQRYPG